jgi:hypothetical protein
MPRLVPAARHRRNRNRRMDLGEMTILKRLGTSGSSLACSRVHTRPLPRGFRVRPCRDESQDPVHRAPRSAAERCAIMKKAKCGNEGRLAGNARTVRADIQ